MALTACENNNLIELCQLLSGATLEAAGSGIMPHNDPAVQLICHQIALVGNGDNTTNDFYTKVYDYCAQQVRNGANLITLEHKLDPQIYPAS